MNFKVLMMIQAEKLLKLQKYKIFLDDINKFKKSELYLKRKNKLIII